VTKWLKKNDLEIGKLRAIRNEIEERVNNLEQDFDYGKIINTLDNKQMEITELEAKINQLLEQKSSLAVDLVEIEEYVNEFSEDIYIEDDDIKTVFEKYKKGLGELAQADLENLYKFRDQLAKFKSNLIDNKKIQLSQEITQINATVQELNKKVSKYYAQISQSDQNNLVKSFRTYKEDIYEFRQFDQQLEKYELATERLNEAKAVYSTAANKLSRIVSTLKNVKESFQTTFIDAHKYITGSSAASFDFTVNVDTGPSRKKDFFKFSAYTETSGSKGSDQIRAAIYDVSLHMNEHTKKKTIGFILHDNLIFGVIDKVSSIKFLNLINDRLGDEIQYIAAINSDDFDYAELREQFTFDVKEKEAINLTKSEPLFHGIYLDFIKRP
jgi:DNA repair ATPase RecN